MHYTDTFLELEYGKLYSLDLHGKTLEEARASLIHILSQIDCQYKGILVVHGYHKGRVLKDYIRNKLSHNLIYKKVNLDAARTILLLSF